MNIKIKRLLVACLAISSLAARADQHDARPDGKQAPVEAGNGTVGRFTVQDSVQRCQASYNRQRNNCTILSGCGVGMLPVAQPPGCSCTCVRSGKEELKPGPAAREQADRRRGG